MKKVIYILTGTRADYGLLKPLILKLSKSALFDVRILVTGSHLSEKFGFTYREIEEDFSGEEIIKIDIPILDDSKKGMCISTGYGIINFSEILDSKKPDLVIILGDRYEALSLAITAHFLNIPIAHISGGDITEGAIDDAIRHSITKMSSLHFPGCLDSANRIIQMGEDPTTVFNVGELGVENCLNVPLLSRTLLSENLNFPNLLNNFAVVTLHPETKSDISISNQVYSLIYAMESNASLYYIITLSNADAGGREMNDIWMRESGKHSNWLVVASLGITRYLSALKHAEFVIGNSSSGIIEAPVFGIPTINIGNRQKGRMMAKSVINCIFSEKDINLAISEAIKFKKKRRNKLDVLPFGNGSSSSQILRILEELFYRNQLVKSKNFFNIEI